MPNPVIDLRRLKHELKGGITPENELPPAREAPMLPTGAAAHPRAAADDGRDPPLLEWTAHESEPEAAGSQLQLLIGGGLVLGGVAAAIFRNFLFALLLVLSGALVISRAYRAPRQIRFAVTGRGIEVGNRRYEFDSLESFWIFYDPPLFRELSVRSRKTFMPQIRIPLGGLDPLQLRGVLLRFLAEEKQEVSPMEIILKRLGF